MTEFVVGGRRRIDRVLDPTFLDGLDDLDLDDIRNRRAEADQEEVDLSYARRMLQGRLDLLRAERQAREQGRPGLAEPRSDQEIARQLATILADEPRVDHGLGRHMAGHVPSRVGEHRREAERAVADVAGSDLAHLSDAELIGSVEHLEEVETRVSRARRQVQQVVDVLTKEIARRYSTGEVPVTLP